MMDRNLKVRMEIVPRALCELFQRQFLPNTCRDAFIWWMQAEGIGQLDYVVVVKRLFRSSYATYEFPSGMLLDFFEQMVEGIVDPTMEEIAQAVYAFRKQEEAYTMLNGIKWGYEA